MKFTNGLWLIREGMSASYPVEIRDVHIEPSRACFYVASRPIQHRGETLGGTLFTITVTAPMEDVLSVRIEHHAGKKNRSPSFHLAKQDGKMNVGETSEDYMITSGGLKLELRKKNGWYARFSNSTGLLADSAFRNLGLFSQLGETEGEYWFNKHQENRTYLREELSLGVGERIYGLGERFTPFVKNGQVVEIWNEDPGTGSEQTYKNIPFYLSNKGYGVFVNHTGRVFFEVGSEKVNRVGFSVTGESLEYLFINGPEPRDVVRRYVSLTGHPAMPPLWSFGLWLTSSFNTEYNEKIVTEMVGGMKERNLPLHVFHFDCFWMKENSWCDFQWDKECFPDPHGMLSRLKALGLKICVWINPYVAQRSVLFEEGRENGYFLKNLKGDVWQTDEWQSGMAIVDFTNPTAVLWFQTKLEAVLDTGVDSFKTDFGERIPTNVVYHDGSDPVSMHNYYTHLYNKTVFEVLEKRFGKGRAALFARSATTGGQQFPVHWGGDSEAHFGSMAETLRGGLSLGLAGFGFWSHDIGGFGNKATPDLYKRWVAFGLLSSHSRLHGDSTYRVPWNYDEESVDVLRFFTGLKCALMPYLYAKAKEAVVFGWPLLRAMMFEFPQDKACEYLDTQYMLGESILVAPVFRPDGVADFYLPEGRWIHLLDGSERQGGKWYREKYGYLSLPLFVKEGTMIPFGKDRTRPDYEHVVGTVFHYFPGEEKTLTSILYDGDGKEAGVELKKEGNNVTVKAKGQLDGWSVLLRGETDLKTVTSEDAETVLEKEGILLRPKKNAGLEFVWLRK